MSGDPATSHFNPSCDMFSMTFAGGRPFADVSGRMEVFGRLFGEQVGIPEPANLPSPESVMAVVKSRVPRTGGATDDAPVLEAAAYVGEWLRHRARHATWIAEGPLEPHLQLVDASHAIVYLLPMVQLLRTASTAGYDGMAPMLRRVLDDVGTPARAAPLAHLRVEPAEERDAVVRWTRENRGADPATRASLWRRCSSCARVDDRRLTLRQTGDDWEEEAATAASLLAASPFDCPCGGLPGRVTRFLMLRHEAGATRLGDIFVSSTHTRVGCWTLVGDKVEPFDALSLASDVTG